MISQLVGSSPTPGSVLTAQSLEPASASVSPSLSAPPPLMLALSLSLSLSLSKIHIKKKFKAFSDEHPLTVCAQHAVGAFVSHCVTCCGLLSRLLPVRGYQARGGRRGETLLQRGAAVAFLG